MPIDPNSLNLFPYINSPAITTNIEVVAGGSLLSGTYYVCFAYKRNIKTDYFYVSQPISIFNANKASDNFAGSKGNQPTSKSIKLTVAGVDISYESLVISVIHYANGVLQPVIDLPDVAIVNDTITYTINSLDIGTFGAIDDIVIDNPNYTKAKGIKFLDNSLYLANVTSNIDLGFQKYANNIKVKGVIKTLENAVVEKSITVTVNDAENQNVIHPAKEPGTNNYIINTLVETDNSFKSEENIIYNKSFRRGEVYALYISLILKNGSRTKAYHIPGRAHVDGELTTVNNNLGFSSELRFQTEANSILNREESPTNNKFELAYWQNKNEDYPNTEDFKVFDSNGEVVDSDLRNTNVRHHRIPEVILDKFTFLGSPAELLLTTYNQFYNGFNIIGLKFEDIYIPPDIKAQISGYELFYAKKNDNNRLMMGQGLVLPIEENNVTGLSDRVLLANEILYPSYSIQNPITVKSEVETTNVQMMVFDMLVNNSKLSKVNYISNLYNVKEYNSWKATLESTAPANFYSSANGKSGGSTISTFTDVGNWTKLKAGYTTKKLRKVIGKSFIPGQTEEVLIQQLGFPSNFNNKKGVSSILLRIEGFDNDPIISNQLELGYVYLSNLCSYKEDVHNPFQVDELVSLYVSTELPETDIAFNTPDVYNGDTFINLFYYKYQTCTRFTRTDANLLACIVESENNISTRLVGDKVEDTFYPAFGNPLTFLEYNTKEEAEDKWWFEYDNYFAYNTDYSKVNNIKQYGIFNTLKVDEELVELPNTIIRSDIISTTDEFRIFRPLNRLDMDRARGEIVKLAKYNNILLIHCLRGLFRTKGKATLVTSEQDVYAGSGNILEQQPDEILSTDYGMGGIQNPYHAISTKFGYFFADQQDKRVYLLSDTLKELSSKEYGMHNYFRTLFDIDAVTFDPYWNRLLLSHNGTTLSFSADFNCWVSFHDYNPKWFFHTLDTVYSIKNNQMWKHNEGDRGNYYGIASPLELELIVNIEPTLTKKLQNFKIVGDYLDNFISRHRLTGSFRITNSYQDSGEIEFSYFTEANGNYRRVNREWVVNKFRDMKNALTGQLQLNKPWYEKRQFVDKYFKIYLKFTNPDGDYLYLDYIDSTIKRNLR